MVAHQRDDAVGLLSLQRDDGGHHLAGLRTAIHIITQKYERVGLGQYLVKERHKWLVATVNISYDTGRGYRMRHIVQLKGL